MAQRVVVQVENAADWLSGNSNARFRLDRSASGGAAFTTSTEVTTTVLVSGTDRYEVYDANGTGTSWYRFRIEDNADVALSDWTTPFQVTARQPIATLASVKVALGPGAVATDDDVLSLFIDGINGRIVQRIGYYPGPSSDTSRTYHGKDAVRNRKRLWIPGGVRSVTTLSIATSTGGSATAATSTDYVLGPDSYDLRPGEPYHWIEFVDVTTGSHSSFAHGYSNVVIAGLFGWGAVPDDLVSVATSWAVHDWKTRNTGGVGVVGSEDFGFTDISRLPFEWRRVIDSYRFVRVV